MESKASPSGVGASALGRSRLDKPRVGIGMKKSLMTAVAVVSVASAAAGCANSGGSSGGAAKYSQPTLNVIVPSSPGGQLDIYARMLQPVLQSDLGATVIVTDNAAGDGVAAYSQVLQNGSNCSYISMGNVPQILYDSMGGSAPIKPGEFAAMENFATDYGTLLVPKNGKYQTFQQLIAAAKANPGKVTIGFQSN
jgi:tripartite-type tricarboxylate transporter receptor subunit TctC